MGIRSMLRKVFGRDREDTTPATSVPPQTRETTSEGDTPDAAVRRAADDLVAASFDNPQVPKARTAETVEAGAETVEAVEPETVEAVEPETVQAVELEAVEAVEPEAVEAEAVQAEAVEPEAVEAEAVEPEAAEAETVQAEAVEPEIVEPEAVAAEAVEPEAVEAEAVEPEAVQAAEVPEAEAVEAEVEIATVEDAKPADVAEPEAVEAETAPEPEAVAVAETAEPAAAPQEQAQDTDQPQVTDTDAVPAPIPTPTPPSAEPALALSAVKAAAPHLADAYKAAGTVLRKQGLAGTRAAVYLVVDRSGSMRGYFKDGSVQRLAEQTVALAAHLDEDATVTTVFFSTDIDGTVDLTPAALTPTRVEEINGTLGRLGRTNYHRAVEEVLAHHEKADPTRPALVVFQTDGAPESKTAATQALAEAADRPLHWRFVAWGEEENKAFDYVRKAAAEPRTAVYFPGATPSETTHAAFYRGLLAGLEI